MSLEIVSGEQIKAWRKYLKMGQKELAQALGRTRNNVGNWERGSTSPPKWLHYWFVGYTAVLEGRKVKKTKKVIPPEIQDKILAAYQAGEKAELIAAIYGVNKNYPGELAKRFNLKLRPCHRPRKS